MADDRALPAFTVFTITYQRTAELGRLFASLCRQTCKDFVWLIVSDETNDATRQAVDQWRGLADFDICYVELAHGGKTRAMREGFRHVRTPLMIDIDDDDELVPHCVAVFKEAWQAVERQGRADIGMINALSVDDEGRVVGRVAAQSGCEDSDYITMEWTRGCAAEYIISRRTATVADAALFDDRGTWLADRVANVRESVYWNRLARRWNTRYLYQPLRIYHTAGASRLSAQRFDRQKCFDYAFSNYVMLRELRGRWHENRFTTLKYMAEWVYCVLRAPSILVSLFARREHRSHAG